MAELFRDIRSASRALIRTPVVSLAAILTIGLAIGGITMEASGVYGMFLRGLPFEDGDRLMRLRQLGSADGVPRSPRIHDYLTWRERQTSFEGLAAFVFTEVNLADGQDRPERYESAHVTANFFTELAARPALGRIFLDEEDTGHTPPSIILGYQVWQDRYAGSPDVIGRTVQANGRSVEIVGVMPEDFRFPFAHDLWLPLGVDPVDTQPGGGPGLWVVGRLARGVTQAQAEAQLSAISRGLAAEYPGSRGGMGALVRPYEQDFMPPEFIGIIWVEIAAALGILLIACANVANLLLGRATHRVKEMAVRTALGANRARIMRLLMMEATLIAGLGGLLGLALGLGLIRKLGGWIESIEKPYWLEFGLEPPVVLFTVGVILLSALAAGVVPALRASGVDVQGALKEGSGASSSLGMARFSTVLVVTQLAISCALLVGAGVMIRSVMNFRSLDLGFDSEGVLTAQVGLTNREYPDDERRLALYAGLMQRIPSLPGVDGAALSDRLPGMGGGSWSLSVEGVDYPADEANPRAHRMRITPGFFPTFGVEMVEGRDFSAEDRARSPPVVIVNESFQGRYLPEGALGRRIRLGGRDSASPWLTVVGVVSDVYVGRTDLGGMRSAGVAQEQLYLPFAQSPPRQASIALKTQGDPLALAAQLRATVAELDPYLPVDEVNSMDGAFRAVTWSFGMLGWTFSTFGALALLMAAIGLYGVIAFSVGRRTKEMGVRMAVGASPRDVMKLIMGRGMKQLGIGMTVGLLLGAGLARPLALVSYQADPNDPAVYAAIILTVLLAGFFACLVPARRAAGVDVVDALKSE